ncbi:MAG: cyanophycinase [Bacteroidota bacterium]
MLERKRLITFTTALSLSIFAFAQTRGPESGALVVVGGGGVPPSVISRFIELAGGPEAPIVLIPTASGSEDFTPASVGLARFSDQGAKNLTILHTRDREEADADAFVQPLKEAGGVWFNGGRQWRLVDAYADTQTEELLWALLERGGVIGGSSAGATIQGSYLARGDTKNNQIMMGDHEEGFGFISNIAIDQHVLARNRQFDLFNILEKRPELLGVGLDESTAMVVQGNEFEVLGESYVLVYDGNFWSREGSDLKKLPDSGQLFYFLREGDRYDLMKRKIIKN